MFEAEKSEMHYICAVGNGQQTTATMLAEYTFVVEMAIHRCDQERCQESFLVMQTTEAAAALVKITHDGRWR